MPASPARKRTAVRPPVAEVGAPREPDVARGPRRHGPRTVEQRVAPAEALGEQGGVLVLGRKQHAAALVRPEVGRGCQTDERPARRVARVDDQVLAVELRDPWILDPAALGLRLEVGQEGSVGIDGPPAEPVGASSDPEIRVPRVVLDPDEEQRLATDHHGRRIEDGVHPPRPLNRRQDRIGVIPFEELCHRFPSITLPSGSPIRL